MFLHVCFLELLNSCIFHIICLHFVYIIIYIYRLVLFSIMTRNQISVLTPEFFFLHPFIACVPLRNRIPVHGRTFLHSSIYEAFFLLQSLSKILECGSNTNSCNLLSLIHSNSPKWKKIKQSLFSCKRMFLLVSIHAVLFRANCYSTFSSVSLPPDGLFFSYQDEPIVQAFLLLNLKGCL